jgi:hypothetical protein
MATSSDRHLKDKIHKMLGSGQAKAARAESKVATAKVMKPEEVIPLDDKELSKF